MTQQLQIAVLASMCKQIRFEKL